MFPRLITKYGLATHLALLASLPLALMPFLSSATLSTLIFWLSGFALIWLLAEPSMRTGEHLSTARVRVRASFLRDPFAWFLLFAIIYSLIRWCNSGVELRYDPEQTVWFVKSASWSALPSSAGDAGRLPFAVSLAIAVLILGIRHGVGLAARVSFGMTASFVAGLGGLAAALWLVLGDAQHVSAFEKIARAGLTDGPYWGSAFGAWLVLALPFGAQAEARKWGGWRLPFCIAVAGNACGLVIFAPSVIAALYMALAILAALWSWTFLGRTASMGSVARNSVLAILGLAVPFFLLAALVSEPVRTAKMNGFDFALTFSESWKQMTETLSRIAREMWMKTPWCGAGVGAFGLHVPFLAEKADWAVIPKEPLFAVNSFSTLLAERGIVGCLVLAVGFGYLLFTYFQKLVLSFIYLRRKDDADVFVFACPPIVWTAPLLVVLMLAEAVVSPVLSLVPVLLAVSVPLAIAAASFPRKSSAVSDSTKKEN